MLCSSLEGILILASDFTEKLRWFFYHTGFRKLRHVSPNEISVGLTEGKAETWLRKLRNVGRENLIGSIGFFSDSGERKNLWYQMIWTKAVSEKTTWRPHFFFEVFRAQTKVERVVTFLYRQLSLALEGPEMQWSCYSQYPNLSNQYCKASTRNNEGFLSNERQKQDCPHTVRTKRFRSILKGFQCWTSNCIPSIYLFPCGCWECHSNFMPYFFPCFCYT